jgi:leucyl aminopeptidase
VTATVTLIEPSDDHQPLYVVTPEGYEAWLATRGASEQVWLQASGYKAKPGKCKLIAGDNGKPVGAVLCVENDEAIWDYAAAAEALPEGRYQLAGGTSAAAGAAAALGWALAAYVFDRYKKNEKSSPELAWPEACDRARVTATAEAIYLARDLVNTPAADLGPAELAAAARGVAETCDAGFTEIIGDDLLTANYPMVHAVGRASDRAPRLLDLRWGPEDKPKVTLVGKGVCFDSGGLDLKPASGMEWMKKDMGGSAAVLGLARMIMALNLPVRLRVLIPAVENSVSGNAFRPGDVLTSRAGLTVEIGNTDAEGRLVLADALTEAVSEAPDLLIDCATLTGAARVALGTELPGFFTDDDDLAHDIEAAARETSDPSWRLPLWQPYRELFKSRIADINNSGEGRFGGAITAALFLQYFAEDAPSWVHFDMYAWNGKSRPGRPIGGEAQAIRALFAMIEKRYST